MNPAGDTLALASIEFDLSKVVEGQQVVVKWRGKPVFVRYRTAKEIAAAIKDDHADLRDPATDASRHKPGKAQWLILVGVCTHLGCVPTFGGGEYGGWLCPCHGSVYDTSGRIRKGPAPAEPGGAGLRLPRPTPRSRSAESDERTFHLRAEDRASSAGWTRACRSCASPTTPSSTSRRRRT